MFSKIQQEKKNGFSREAAARHLELSWATVDRYWNMTPDDYETARQQLRKGVLGPHNDLVLKWLESYPDVSASQIRDWLEEHYGEVFNERTVRNHVMCMRKLHSLPKPSNTRDYSCVPEQPPGQQLQVDFGTYHAIRRDKNRIALHFAVFILAHSRYKYIVWQERPFTSIDFVRALESCFEHFGGMPKELVMDQDRLMIVNENYGDIIYTHEFERCKAHHGFIVWLCRKADPESKGMVESGVKFIKYNFARHRIFENHLLWTIASEDWLTRTGNGKKHAETKKIPADMFALEKAHLKPVVAFAKQESSTDRIPTPIRKNNSIRYRGSRYSVPLGTYNRSQEAFLEEVDGRLEIYEASGALLASQPLASAPGELIKNRSHGRDMSEKVTALLAEANTALGGSPEAGIYLARIVLHRKRYIRDQMLIVLAVAKKYDPVVLRHALLACLDIDSTTTTDLKDLAEHLFHQITLEETHPIPPSPKVPATGPFSRTLPFTVTQHDASVYNAKIRKGGA